MDISVCENLKEYRKNKGNTQEELAEYIGISVQAVSKWERGESYPDITLLPKVSAYYDVSVDDLLGVGKIREKEKIAEYDKKCGEFSAVGDIESELALRKEAVHEFPNNLRVLDSYMSAMWNKNKRGDNPNEYADEIIKAGERILKEAVDEDWLRYSVIQTLCYIYARIGNKEKSREYAGKAPIYYITARELYTRSTEGEEAFAHIQRNILELTDLIELNICQELMKKKEFSNSEKRYMYNYVLSLFNLLFPNGDFGFYFNRTSNLYCHLATCDATDGDLDGTINNLKLAAEHAIKYDTLEAGQHTSFLVNRQSYGKGSPNSNNNSSHDILTRMQDNIFDFCRENEKFKEIEENLKKYAN